MKDLTEPNSRTFEISITFKKDRLLAVIFGKLTSQCVQALNGRLPFQSRGFPTSKVGGHGLAQVSGCTTQANICRRTTVVYTYCNYVNEFVLAEILHRLAFSCLLCCDCNIILWQRKVI